MEEISIEELVLAGYNPRRMRKSEMEKLKRSIREFGFVEPVVVNSNPARKNIIIGGHQRVEALKALGLKKVPVIFVNLDENKEKMLNIALNKITGEWDEVKLIELLNQLTLSSADVLLTGFDNNEIDMLLSGLKPVVEDDFNVAQSLLKPKYDVKRGEVWQIGSHRLMCGDATNAEDVDKLMNGMKADLVVTDPPFNIGYKSGGQKKEQWAKSYGKDNRSEGEYIILLRSSFANIKRVLRDNGVFYIWSGWNSYHISWECLDMNKLSPSCCIIWDKGNPGMGWSDYRHQYEIAQLGVNTERELTEDEVAEFIFYGFLKGKEKHFFNKKLEIRRSDFWFIKRDPTLKYHHPTQKPVKLMEKALLNSSIKGEIVLDVFGGSGTTLITAEQMERICYMMEIDPAFCSTIIERWEAFTGKTAIRVSQ